MGNSIWGIHERRIVGGIGVVMSLGLAPFAAYVAKRVWEPEMTTIFGYSNAVATTIASAISLAAGATLLYLSAQKTPTPDGPGKDISDLIRDTTPAKVIYTYQQDR